MFTITICNMHEYGGGDQWEGLEEVPTIHRGIEIPKFIGPFPSALEATEYAERELHPLFDFDRHDGICFTITKWMEPSSIMVPKCTNS